MLSTQDQLLLGGILNVKGLCVYLEYLDLTQFFLSTGERIYQMSTSRSQCWCSPLGKIYSLSNINYRVTVFTQQE
jgi:hypothetical protein